LRRHWPPSSLLMKSKDRHSPVKAFGEKVRLSAQDDDGLNCHSPIQAFTPEIQKSSGSLMSGRNRRQYPLLGVTLRGDTPLRFCFAVGRPYYKCLPPSGRLSPRGFSTRRFDGPVGNSNYVLHDGVHSHCRVGRPFFPGWNRQLSHPQTLPE
jgi:hypothetical protein